MAEDAPSTRTRSLEPLRFEMYLIRMDQGARDDIAAAAAAHKELGPEFDSAVAESLVERIGAEIDKRVDARLGTYGGSVVQRPVGGQPGISQHVRRPIALALGSMAIGVGATAVVVGGSAVSGAEIFLCVLIWLVVGVINVVYNWRN